MSAKKTDLPPPAPGDPPGGRFETANNSNDSPDAGGFVSADQVVASGWPAGLQLTGTAQLAAASATNSACRSKCAAALNLVDSSIVEFNANGTVASFDGGRQPITGVTAFGNDGLIAWGVGKDNLGQDYHYVTGAPAMFTDLASLAISQPVAHFQLIGGSTPTAVDSANGQTVTGALTGGTLEAQFGAGQVNLALNITIADHNLAVQANKVALYSENGVLAFYGNSATCTFGVCTGEVKGFIGAGAARAGTVYQLDVTSANLPGPVTGSAAFANTGAQ
jgi:hypothetical protein